MAYLLTSRFFKNSIHRQKLLCFFQITILVYTSVEMPSVFILLQRQRGNIHFCLQLFYQNAVLQNYQILIARKGFQQIRSPMVNLTFSKLKCTILPCIYRRCFQNFFSSPANKNDGHLFSETRTNNSLHHQNMYIWKNTECFSEILAVTEKGNYSSQLIRYNIILNIQ